MAFTSTYFSKRTLAIACHKMLPQIEAVLDIETQQALGRVCDPDATISRSDAQQLAVALLLQVRERKARTRPARR